MRRTIKKGKMISVAGQRIIIGEPDKVIVSPRQKAQEKVEKALRPWSVRNVHIVQQGFPSGVTPPPPTGIEWQDATSNWNDTTENWNEI